MNNRLAEIIKYKTGGKQTAFAQFMGWSPQYLSKLVRGDNFGLAPVVALLQKLPEVDARWLLLGEGEMLCDEKLTEVRATAQSYVTSILEMEKYLPVMTPEEVAKFEQMCIGNAQPQFDPSLITEWQRRLTEREQVLNLKFRKALCRRTTASR